MTGPEQHAATVRDLIEQLCMDSLEIPFKRLLANREFHETQQVSAMFLRLHDEVVELVALAGRADELQDECHQWNALYGRLDKRRRDAEARADELQRERDELRETLSQTDPVVTYPGTATGTQEETCVTLTAAARDSEGTPDTPATAPADVPWTGTGASTTFTPRAGEETENDAPATPASLSRSGHAASEDKAAEARADELQRERDALDAAFTGGTLGGVIREVTYPGGVDTVLWTPQGQTPQRENANAPQYSPDGTKILFFVSLAPGGGGTSSRQGLWVMDADGSNATQLDGWVTVADPDSGYLDSGTQAAWSHDSAWIAYVDRGFGSDAGVATSGTFSLWKIRPDGTDKTLLADGASATVGHWMAHDAWLPDDSAVICSERAVGAGRKAIISAAADGSGSTTIVSTTDGPKGTQNFEACWRDERNNRVNWIYQTSPTPLVIRTCEVDGTDMQDTYAPVDATVASGTGFEWV